MQPSNTQPLPTLGLLSHSSQPPPPSTAPPGSRTMPPTPPPSHVSAFTSSESPMMFGSVARFIQQSFPSRSAKPDAVPLPMGPGLTSLVQRRVCLLVPLQHLPNHKRRLPLRQHMLLTMCRHSISLWKSLQRRQMRLRRPRRTSKPSLLLPQHPPLAPVMTLHLPILFFRNMNKD